jgi:hypothetical protein
MIRLNEILLNNCKEEIKYKEAIVPTKQTMIRLHDYAMDWMINSNPLRLPCCPPPEKHPYADLYPVNYNYSKFIIGTFPPISYMSDIFKGVRFCTGKKVSKPQLPFYHGNRRRLWKYLLSDKEFSNLSAHIGEQRIGQLISFLRENGINYADIISYCQRLEYNSDDSNLYNIILNEQLLEILNNSKSSEILLVFNTGSLFTNRGIKFYRDGRINPGTFVFDMFLSLLLEAGKEIYIEFQNQDPIKIDAANKDVLSQYHNIIRFDLIINGRKAKVVAGPSPADGDGTLHDNRICQRFKNIYHTNEILSPGELKKRFKSFVYRTALLGNADLLYELNNE